MKQTILKKTVKGPIVLLLVCTDFLINGFIFAQAAFCDNINTVNDSTPNIVVDSSLSHRDSISIDTNKASAIIVSDTTHPIKNQETAHDSIPRSVSLPTSSISNKPLTFVHREFIRFGINTCGGLTFMSDLNKIANAWFESKDDSLNSNTNPVSHKNFEVSVNLEYGLQPFFAVTLWNFWQIGGKTDFLWSPHLYNFMQSDTIKIGLMTYVPGIFTSLRLGKFEFEGGLLYGISTINWDDSFFGYSSKWTAADFGYEIKLNFSPHRKYVGFNLSAGYRGLVMSSVFDNAGRKIYFSDTGNPVKIDMSGFTMNIGLYFLLSYRKAG